MLGMRWNNQIYIDTCLPFGLPSAPKLFNILADLLSWILQSKGVLPVLHYLDDFLTLGPPSTTTCVENLMTIKEVCLQLSIPLALDKAEVPSKSSTFLGIVLDTERMEARLPEEKLACVRHQLEMWQKRQPKDRFCLWLVYSNMLPKKCDQEGPLFPGCTTVPPAEALYNPSTQSTDCGKPK